MFKSGNDILTVVGIDSKNIILCLTNGDVMLIDIQTRQITWRDNVIQDDRGRRKDILFDVQVKRNSDTIVIMETNNYWK